ncbi:ArsR/SmtB family transcription factor [Frigidibacter oleivorans]|uniref:ArsR/SmtB family transcription factor n=1 Tax=Frigidibacter oleivorans TaxID=2487129 RepID=UPI000F8E879A|nr:metalloregulator ArsR/SmtB family transcription factor [Frigidibacter oleivorans]
MDIETATRQLRAIGHDTRLQLYRLLVRAGPGGLPVGEVQARLGLPGSTLSHHLRRLVDTGLVRQDRHGTSLICTAVYPAMQGLVDYLAGECCADAPDAETATAPPERAG